MSEHLNAQIAKVSHDRACGKPIKTIAHEMGVTHQRISQIIAVAGLTRTTALAGTDEARVRQMWDDGLSLNQMARALGVTKNVVNAYARKRNWVRIAQAADAT